MLKKIDCVMIRVDDVAAGEKFYSEVFGLKALWREAGSVGMALPETNAEVVLHNNSAIPHKVEVHYLVDDVVAAVKQLRRERMPRFGATIRRADREVRGHPGSVRHDHLPVGSHVRQASELYQRGRLGAERNRDDEGGSLRGRS